MRLYQPHRNGMTLTEILAVVVILSLLTATLAIALGGRLGAANHEIAKTQVNLIAGNVETFKNFEKRYPSPSEGLQVLASKPNAPYFVEAEQLSDPWGNPYQYVVPGPDGKPFEVISYGADASPGGEDENADISSAR